MRVGMEDFEVRANSPTRMSAIVSVVARELFASSRFFLFAVRSSVGEALPAPFAFADEDENEDDGNFDCEKICASTLCIWVIRKPSGGKWGMDLEDR